VPGNQVEGIKWSVQSAKDKEESEVKSDDKVVRKLGYVT